MLGDGSENMDNMNDDYNDLMDNAAIEDADIFEVLGSPNRSATAIPEHAASDEVPVSLPLPETEDQDIQPEVANSESNPLVVIDPFPHGKPGMPISQGSYMDDADCPASNGSIWAPFYSQRDWEVAKWAKMRGPTSSAMTDLLAIPKV